MNKILKIVIQHQIFIPVDEILLKLGWVVGFKANCPLVGPRPTGEELFVGVFLRNPRPYLCEFRKKPQPLIERNRLNKFFDWPVYCLGAITHHSTFQIKFI